MITQEPRPPSRPRPTGPPNELITLYIECIVIRALCVERLTGIFILSSQPADTQCCFVVSCSCCCRYGYLATEISVAMETCVMVVTWQRFIWSWIMQW